MLTRKMGVTVRKALAVCGLLAPISYVIMVLVASLLTPGYNHVTQVISELGKAGNPGAVVLDTGLVLFGLLLIPFALGLHGYVTSGEGLRLAPGLLVVFGVTNLLQGAFFPWPTSEHALLGLVGFGAMLVVAIAFAQGVRGNDQWRRYSLYSMLTGVVLVVYITISGVGGEGLIPWSGLLQRLLVEGPLLLWIEVVGIGLYTLPSSIPQS